MNKILLINNRSATTGIGNYSHQLIKHLKKINQTRFSLLNLFTVAEDSFGGVVDVFSQKIKRFIDHFFFLSKINPGYEVYHLLNPNLGLLIAKYRPVVVTVHDVIPFTQIATPDLIAQSYGLDLPIIMAMRFNMGFIKYADKIIAISKHTKKDLTSLLDINPSRIIVIYPGIDRDQFRFREKRKAREMLNLPLKKKLILRVGVDEPRKNFRTLIKAFYKVKKRAPDTLLINIGGMRSISKKLISSLQLSNSVMHFSKVPNIALFYNAADLLAFPSYYEGFGLPVLEAMASGLPVIAGNSSSIPEIVNQASLLFPPFNVKMLSDLILQVLTDENTRHQMVEKGFERSQRFDWNICAKQTLEVYKTLYS
jgi:glycosyltransferase involved in cell wall biosynthesis